jgi:hypothetical protein
LLDAGPRSGVFLRPGVFGADIGDVSVDTVAEPMAT